MQGTTVSDIDRYVIGMGANGPVIGDPSFDAPNLFKGFHWGPEQRFRELIIGNEMGLTNSNLSAQVMRFITSMCLVPNLYAVVVSRAANRPRDRRVTGAVP